MRDPSLATKLSEVAGEGDAECAELEQKLELLQRAVSRFYFDRFNWKL